MRRPILAALVGTFALSASAVLARRVQVPVEGHGKILLVEATINQRVTGRFVLDTGASYCVLSKAAAKDAGVKADGAKIHISTANGVIEATLAEARRIEVGDAIAREVEVAVVDKDPTPGLQGLIGLSFLQHFKYSVDSGSGSLLLEN